MFKYDSIYFDYYCQRHFNDYYWYKRGERTKKIKGNIFLELMDNFVYKNKEQDSWRWWRKE